MSLPRFYRPPSRAGLNHGDATMLLPLAFAFMIILSIAISQLFLALLALFGLLRFLKGQRVPSTAIDVPLLLFLTARILSVFLSTMPEMSVRLLYAELPIFLTYFILRPFLFDCSENGVRTVLFALIAGAIVASLWGSANVLLGYVPRATSMTSGYYTLGTYLTAILGLVLFLGSSDWLFRRRWQWFLVVLILLAGIVLTMNRIHWGIAGLLIIVVGALRERRLLGVAVALAALAVLLVPGVATRLEQSIHFASNLSDRDWLWKGAIQLAGEHPWFGFGPLTFREIFPFLGEIADKGIGGWHNDYLQVYVESGLVGLAAFLAFLGAGVWSGIQVVRSSRPNSERRRLAQALLVAFGTIMLSALTGRALLDLLIVMLQGVLLALLVPISALEGKNVQSSS